MLELLINKKVLVQDETVLFEKGDSVLLGDYSAKDGDIVAVMLADTVFLRITLDKDSIVALPTTSNKVVIKVLSEGSVSPCTLFIRVKNPSGKNEEKLFGLDNGQKIYILKKE